MQQYDVFSLESDLRQIRARAGDGSMSPERSEYDS